MDIRCIVDAKNKLGEGPLWDPIDGVLYWVDILEPAIWRCAADGGDVRKWNLPAHVGCMALRAGGGAILALSNGFHSFDFETGACEAIADPEADNPQTRFNDGKVDRRGRLLAGTMDYNESDGIGGLYRLDPDLTVTKLDDGFVVSNAPCWSPDDKTFYFADSAKARIYTYEYDLDSGVLSDKRTFASGPADKGLPDGATVDREGYLWNCRWNGRCILRFAPNGTIDRVVELPMQSPTSCTFGGPDLDILYVTSMPMPDHPADAPNAGGLVAITGLGVTGWPEPRFAG